MTFTPTVVEGGKASTPEHRRTEGATPVELGRSAIITRVAAAIWEADGEDMPGFPTFQSFVDGAYMSADTNPQMLEIVSDTYRMARAAIEAMKPPEPQYDEAVITAVVPKAYGPDAKAGVIEVSALTHTVTAWIDEVLE